MPVLTQLSQLPGTPHCLHWYHALPEEVDAITQFAQLTTVKGLQEFVGMVNFYRRFIPGATQKMTPLFEALS